MSFFSDLGNLHLAIDALLSILSLGADQILIQTNLKFANALVFLAIVVFLLWITLRPSRHPGRFIHNLR